MYYQSWIRIFYFVCQVVDDDLWGVIIFSCSLCWGFCFGFGLFCVCCWDDGRWWSWWSCLARYLLFVLCVHEAELLGECGLFAELCLFACFVWVVVWRVVCGVWLVVGFLVCGLVVRIWVWRCCWCCCFLGLFWLCVGIFWCGCGLFERKVNKQFSQ